MRKQVLHTQKAPQSRSMGPNVRQVIPSALADVDPFVFLDHFGPFERQPGSQGVPPHPHAGIATVTYLFEGSNRHQDSYGHDAMVQAGDLAWMQAGKGIVHAEGMNENKTQPETVHGLQLWISLPAKDKFIEPDFYHYPAAELPRFQHGGAAVKVVVGSLLGHHSPVKSLSPAYLFEVKLLAGQSVELPFAVGDTCGLYLVTGHLEVGGQQLLPTSITHLDENGDTLLVQASADSHFVLLGGTPLREPIVGYASYVMNSEAQIRQVMQDYQLGKMGTVKA